MENKNYCIDCGKEIHKTSVRCRSCANKGDFNPYFKGGKSHCEECGKEICYSWKGHIIKKCRECFIKFNRGINHSNYIDGRSFKKYYCKCGQEISWQTAINGKGECSSCSKIGDKNPSFIDNRTSKWKKVRNDCFERDKYTCILCGQKGIYLNAHHIINRHECINFFDLNNLVTLCKHCHQFITNIEKSQKYLFYKSLFVDYINRQIVLIIDKEGNFVVTGE
jgi:hypothetical protein